jgi:hypothetical protein
VPILGLLYFDQGKCTRNNAFLFLKNLQWGNLHWQIKIALFWVHFP